MKKTIGIVFVILILLAACDGPKVPGIPQLGKVWNEKEGQWTGVWTRRGNSGVFDAVWHDPKGEETRDIVTFESYVDHVIVLYRKGTNGRYRGRLSDDETKVENGKADWSSEDYSWSATINK